MEAITERNYGTKTNSISLILNPVGEQTPSTKGAGRLAPFTPHPPPQPDSLILGRICIGIFDLSVGKCTNWLDKV